MKSRVTTQCLLVREAAYVSSEQRYTHLRKFIREESSIEDEHKWDEYAASRAGMSGLIAVLAYRWSGLACFKHCERGALC